MALESPSVPFQQFDLVTIRVFHKGQNGTAMFHGAGFAGNAPTPLANTFTSSVHVVHRQGHARKSKHYSVAQEEARPDPYASRRHLPRTLTEGETAQVPVLVGDALDAARRDGELRQTTLGVRIVGACPEDGYSFRHERELPREDAKVSTFYGGIVAYFPVKVGMPQRINTHHWFEFDLPIDLLREGENSVEVTMERHFEPLTADRILQS